MTAALARDFIFGGNILCEGFFSPLAVVSSAARADLVRSVSDDPCGASNESALRVALFRLKPQSGTFGWSRHSFLISSMACKVV
jgi:hypothetical protein